MDNTDTTLEPKLAANTDSNVSEATPKYEKLYTYADYIKWNDDKRWELIDGIPHLMSAPNRRHQELLTNLFLQLATFVKGKPCKVYVAPFDVRLNADTLDNIVVQPDIVVICDKSKLDEAGCKGPPDMIAEILSPSTSRHDMTRKFNAYKNAGVREYWIVNPDTKIVAVHILTGSEYIIRPYTDEDNINVHVLDGCEIILAEVFEE